MGGFGDSIGDTHAEPAFGGDGRGANCNVFFVCFLYAVRAKIMLTP